MLSVTIFAALSTAQPNAGQAESAATPADSGTEDWQVDREPQGAVMDGLAADTSMSAVRS